MWKEAGAFVVSVVFWGFILLTSTALFPCALLIRALTSPLDKRLVLLHRFTCFWASLYTWLNPLWKVTVTGREKVRPNLAYVMISNHQSLVDILVLFRLHTHFKWVSKIENFRIPLVGWNMSLNRYIKLDRESMKSHLRMMRDCEKALNAGSSVMIFPEGTRSPDGRLRPFKEGAFELALRTKKPLLPIVILGSTQALPKRGFILRGTHLIKMKILDPLPYESFSDLNSAAMRQKVYTLMHSELERMRDEQRIV
jgi:1-acyl-sn-glycerol-3-phosphate acyltransferase